ncbi:MAG: 4-hydroxy-tetrahydrodipicolinate reductase [Spirochaetes bacterium]|nr:4-hydroxy-tetrahydrodipicolinate reductase [Spirochaetota bacterium]
MINVGICGARGRMGMMNVESVLNDTALKLSAALEVQGHPDIGKDIFTFLGKPAGGVVITDNRDTFLSACDVVIDFTAASASLELIALAVQKPVGYVLGSTGFTDADRTKLADYANKIPIVYATNMSVGVNVLFALVERAAQLLGGFEVEIIEAHHDKKKDSPSGTALSLAEVVAKEFGLSLNEKGVYGRKGMVGERTKDEIGIHAVRAGDIVGEHTVMFCRDGERVELTHKAHSRKNFSLGAMQAAKWLSGKKNGLFSMRDVLGL